MNEVHETQDNCQRSAGILVICKKTDRMLLIKSAKGHWDFPKGHIEDGEDSVRTALRELQEETGVTIQDKDLLQGFQETICYVYDEGGSQIPKTVTFFLTIVDSEVDIELSDEHTDAKWAEYSTARILVKYEEQISLLNKAFAYAGEAKSQD